MVKKLKIATRKSNLALKQVEEVVSILPKDIKHQIISIDSFGDKNKSLSLVKKPPSDVFTREIDEQVVLGKADIAIHSAKDLPNPLNPGIEVIALLPCLDNTDSLVSLNGKKLNELKKGAKIGTSSAMRMKEIVKIRPDLKTVEIRGTIEERLCLIDGGEIDAIIVATCALKRLGLEHRVSETLKISTHPLQGHLAIVAKIRNQLLKQVFRKYDVREKYGKVFLIGAGPGDPELITVKGRKLLEMADIVVYDDLIDSNLLENSKSEKIYVGKRRAKQAFSQKEICELLYHNAKDGKNIVRLKGGDPFIFGRGGEEFQYLQERLINVEVIPGITTSLAAAASLGIPLTKRGISSGVAFLTAHDIDKIEIPDVKTLVYYMAAHNAKDLFKKLIKRGIKAEMPSCCIMNATLPGQKILYGSIKELSDLDKSLFVSPIIVIVGEVVSGACIGNNFYTSKTTLYLGTDPASYVATSSAKQFQLFHHPLIEIIPIKSYEKADLIIKSIDLFDFVIFTSKYAVQFFFERLKALKFDSRSLFNLKIVSIGKQTSLFLAKYGILSDIEASNESSGGIVEEFRKNNIKGKKILIPRSNLAEGYLPRQLKNLGNFPVPLVLYKTVKPKDIKKINLLEFERIVFTSPSTVRNYMSIYKKIPKDIEIVAKGDRTLKEIKKYAKI